MSISLRSDVKINLLGSLSSQGGGEQSLIKFYEIFRNAGLDVNLIPWGKVNDKWSEYVNVDFDFESIERAEKGIPLFFYANDQIYEFCKSEKAKHLFNISSKVIIGINFVAGPIPKTKWMADTGKLRLVTFLNNDKKVEWYRGKDFFDMDLIQVPNVVDEKLLEVDINKRENKLIVGRMSRGDSRKFVTADNCSRRGKKYRWQKIQRIILGQQPQLHLTIAKISILLLLCFGKLR